MALYTYPGIFKPSVLIVLLIAFGQSDPYVIRNFHPDQIMDPSEDSLFSPVVGTEFRSSEPELVRRGLTYLRIKRDKDMYYLYEGKFRPQWYPKVFAFKVAGLDYKEKVKTKFFLKRLSLPHEDIQVVYIDYDYVMVPGIPVLYYNNAGEWIKVFAEKSLPARLIINTDPQETGVYVENRKIGETPMVLAMAERPYIRVQLKKEGYYEIDLPLKIEGGAQIEHTFSLTPRITPYDTSRERLNLRLLALHDAQSVWEYYRRRAVVLERFAYTQKLFERSSGLFSELYPVLNPGTVAESTEEFNKRKKEYETKKSREMNLMVENFTRAVREYQETINSINSAITAIEFAYRSDTLTGTMINEFQYDEASKKWGVKILVNQEPFVFRFSGKTSLEKRLGDKIRSNLADADLIVHYWNMQYRTKSGKRYNMALDSLEIKYGNNTFYCPGKFLFPKKLTSTERFQEIAEKAKIFKAERINLQEKENERLRKMNREKEVQLTKKRAIGRKNPTRILSGAFFAVGGIVFSYLAYDLSEASDDYYLSYQSALTREETERFREKVQEKDERVGWYGTLSSIGFGISFLIFTF
ncbi:PEGA domain-containing protein [Fibrobacterota bacterium]